MAMPAAPSTSDVFTIERAEQLKALGHPLRLRVLEMLGDEGGEPLTNRELAQKLGVDPGHLHFHVRMLLRAGLIERAEGGKGREKPYRAVASTVRVGPELLGSRLTGDLQAAMLNEVQAAFAKRERGSVPQRAGDGARHSRAGDRADHRARREGARSRGSVRRPDRDHRVHASSDFSGRSGELSSTAKPRRVASACRTSTVSATGMSSRYSLAVLEGLQHAPRSRTCSRSRPSPRCMPARRRRRAGTPDGCGSCPRGRRPRGRGRGRGARARRRSARSASRPRPHRARAPSGPPPRPLPSLRRARAPSSRRSAAPSSRRERRRCSRGSARPRGAATPTPRPARPAISSASPAPPAALPIRVNCRWRASGSSGQPCLAVLVASRLPREMLVPAGHSREDNLLA